MSPRHGRTSKSNKKSSPKACSFPTTSFPSAPQCLSCLTLALVLFRTAFELLLRYHIGYFRLRSVIVLSPFPRFSLPFTKMDWSRTFVQRGCCEGREKEGLGCKLTVAVPNIRERSCSGMQGCEEPCEARCLLIQWPDVGAMERLCFSFEEISGLK
jgi:hypothetical protein